LESSSQFLKLALFIGEVIARPDVGLIVVLHGYQVAKRGLLEDEVGNWLHGLLLSHDYSDLLRLLVSQELDVSSTAFLPLLISESVELAALLEDALFSLFTSLLLNLGEISLYKGV
jgi:hypothetical protein